jgi:hypothetical protein
VSVAEYDGIVNDDLNDGESRIYSSAAGAAVAILTALADGSINIVAPNKVIIDTDVIANLVSLFEHMHYDSWGKPTSAPIPQGAAINPPPATVTIESNIDTQTNSKTIDGKQFLLHKHGGVTTGGGTSGGVA